MERIFNMFFNAHGNLIPLVPMVDDNTLCGFSSSKYSEVCLEDQVKVIASILKSEDHLELIIANQEINNVEAVLKMARLFKEENMEVVGVYCQQMTKESFEVLSRELKYGAVEGKVYMIGEEKTYKKTLQ